MANTKKTTSSAKSAVTYTFLCSPEEEDQVIQGQRVKLKLWRLNEEYDFEPSQITLPDVDSSQYQVEVQKKPDKEVDTEAFIYLNTTNLKTGPYQGKAWVNPKKSSSSFSSPQEAPFFLSVVSAEPEKTNVQVSLNSDTGPLSDHLVLWSMIDYATQRISFTGNGTNGYQQYIDGIMCDSGERLYRGADSYEQLIACTQEFLLSRVPSANELPSISSKLQSILEKRFGERIDAGFVTRSIDEYFVQVNNENVLPYLHSVDSRLSANREVGCASPIQERLTSPLFIELIWNYWQEENMLNQALQVISLRFQNRQIPGQGKALGNFAIDPLRRINNLLWGYIQKEGSRLSVSRRSGEYDHQYGLRLEGKAVGDFSSAESRSKFLEAFHNLLHLATLYYKQFDDTTVRADPFPLRNALREVHLVLSEGSHNQYGDLPWTSRVEMMAQQYILARPEMREFLGGRTMVAYAEPWMDRLDAVKKVMGWGDTGSTHFRDLAFWGERLLLSIRFDQWNDISIQPDDAASWAEFWRNDIQGYIHAYRSVTGVDLSKADTLGNINSALPAKLLAQRMKGGSKTRKRVSKSVDSQQNGSVSQETYAQHYRPV